MNLRRKLAFFMALDRYVQVILSGIPPLSLAKAKANSLTSLKAFGGTKENYGIPTEYTQIDYAIKKGTAGVQGKFDTGIKPTADDVKIEMKVKIGDEAQASGQTTVGSFYACQARATASSDITGISGSSASGSINGMQSGQSVASGIVRVKDHIDIIRYEYKNGTHSIYVKDLTTNTEDTQTGTYTFAAPTKNLYIFGNTTTTNNLNNNNAIYYCKIWESGTLVFDAVPVIRDSDNKVGLYDKVSERFIEPIITEGGGFEAGTVITPTPSDPMDIYCNNGKISVLDHTNWNVITNPNQESGKGMFINTSGVLSKASDRGAGVFIPVTVGKKYTVLINKQTTSLGSIIRYGQSNNGDLPSSSEQLLDWYRGNISDGMMISFTAKRPYFVMQLGADFVESGGINEAIEVIEAAGDNETIAMFGASYDNAYDEVPYLESATTGSTGAYIDTGFKPDSNTKIQAMFSVASVSAAQCLIGARNQSSGNSRYAFAVWANVGGRIRFDYQSGNVQQSGAGIVANTDYIVIKDGRYNTIDGVAQSANDEETFTCDYNMALFGINTADSISNLTAGKLYYCKIWDNGTLVRDFVPVRRRSDGELGMYDKVNSVFYANAGTGDFTTSYQTATANNLFAINTYKDVQEIITGATTHKVGVYVFNGTEDWTEGSTTSLSISKTLLKTSTTVLPSTSTDIVCTHYQVLGTSAVEDAIWVGSSNVNFRVRATYATISDWKTFLAAQYAAGTPVILVYPLATEYTEPAPIAQTMTVVDGDNTVSLTQQGMTPLELEATYTQQQ